jgi:hypothetical protein
MALLTSSQILDLDRLANAEDWDAMVAEMLNRVEKEPGKGIWLLSELAKLNNVPANTNAALSELDPMSDINDMIVGGLGGVPTRLPILNINGVTLTFDGTNIVWKRPSANALLSCMAGM